MKNRKRISIFEPSTLILGITLAVLSAAICMQIMGQVGITPNTSLIGVVLVMIVARIPFMLALGIGMILRGYSVNIFNGFDVGQSHIPQGIMIGAGLIALIQVIHTITEGNKKSAEVERATEESIIADIQAKKILAVSLGLFLTGAVLVASIAGVFSEMNLGMSVLWVAFSGLTAVITMILVGTSSMHSGWAPAFAVVTICLTIGMLIGFPPMPLAVLVGYIGAVGMPLADTGIGLKTGWLIRGKGKDKAYEKHGRKQQVIWRSNWHYYVCYFWINAY